MKTDEEFHRQKLRVQELCSQIEAGDAAAVRHLLADGCPVSNKRVRNTLALAIARAETPQRWSIVEAIREAGADATSEQICEAIKPSLRTAKLHIVEQAMERGYLGQPEIDELLCAAATGGYEDAALWLLKRGARPQAVPKNLFGSIFTALELSAHGCGHKVTSAMVNRLTQDEKDALLLTFVKDGREYAIPALLEGGANAEQTVKGRNLLQLAPAKATAIRRLLRAAKTSQRIEAAMTESDEAPSQPSTTHPFVL